MLNLTDQVNGIDSCDAVLEWNTFKNETQNAILDTGQTLESGTPANKQLQIAMSIYATSAPYFNCTNTGDAYSLSIVGSKQANNVYVDGELIRFRPSANNTGASTISRSGLSVKDIVLQDGTTALPAGSLRTTYDALARYSSALGKYILLDNSLGDLYNVDTSSVVTNSVLQYDGSKWVAVSGFSLPTEYIQGLLLENEAGDTEHDIKVNIGKARAKDDSTDIALNSALIKQIDANWGLGSNAGGFPSGLTLANNTEYFVFVISKPDGTSDAGFDNSLTAANLLSGTDAGGAGFTKYKRVGSIFTDGSANILNGYWKEISGGGLIFKYSTRVEIFNQPSAGSMPSTFTDLSVLAPANSDAILHIKTDADAVDYEFKEKTSGVEWTAIDGTSTPTGNTKASVQNIILDSSSNIQHKYTATGSNTQSTFIVYTLGYIDSRVD